MAINVQSRLVQVLAAVTILRLIFPASVYEVAVKNTSVSNMLIGSVIAVMLLVMWIALTLFKRQRLASLGLIITLMGFSLSPDALQQYQPFIAVLAITVLARDWRVFSLLTIILFSITSRQVVTNVAEGQPLETTLNQFSLIAAMATTSITIRYFVNAIQTTLLSAERSANLLRIAAEIGQMTVGLVTLDDLLPRAVSFIRDRFGYYHVQIFLVDESGAVAWLRASTGEVGYKLMARKHHLNVGSNSVIGRVTQSGEPIIARDTDSSGVHYRNELLPSTRSELALPIFDSERVVGALDVQSTHPDAFTQGDVQALQIMTNLLAASIRNAQLFEQQKHNMQENQRLYIEAEANLREIRRLNRRLTRESWLRFTQQQSPGVVLAEGGEIAAPQQWSALTTQAIETRNPVVNQINNSYQVAVPIMLRGEVIGAVEIEPDPTLDEADTVEILRVTSERLAVSLDNARLFEESQETTLYEQRLNHIVGQYQNLNTVDELLQVTLEELGESLGAERGAIRLSSEFNERSPAPLARGASADDGEARS
jgi:GAF domain-containing protein